MNFELWDEWDK